MTAETTRLERIRLDAIEDRIDAELALGLHDGLVDELQSLVGEHPFRERLWGQLMLAQYRCGRQADALESFQQARQTLADAHGLDPGPELQRLQSAILEHTPTLTITKNERPAGNLPTPLTTFIGRHYELAELRRRLRDCRLLTLTGPPGVGKTRLAVEVAGAGLGDFPDGTWLIELASLTDPDGVGPVVASTLGVRESGRTLTDHLRDRRALLVVDNCEHLLPGVALLVDRLLAACPRVHVVATSREPLGVAGEALWPVSPLSLPGADIRDSRELLGSEAVRLFEDRAVKVRPSFAITPETAPVIADLCRRLDGLPLAIELAAARVRVLPVGHIAAALEDRFRFLVSRSHTAPPRRQTLRATLDWSYDLLDPAERIVFPLLSVFPGGFSLEAAGAVGEVAGVGRDEMFDLVTALMDKSLLTADADPDGPPRFGMLETIRAYGRERLAEQGGTDRARHAHRGFFLTFAEAAEVGVRRAGYRAWHRRVSADYDNLRIAFDGALGDGDIQSALRIGASLWLFWGAADRHAEGCAWLEAGLAASTESVPARIRAAAYTTLSYLAGQRHDVDRAIQAGERAVALALDAGDEWETARAKQTLALVLGAAGEPERAATMLAQARVVMAATGDDFWMAASDLIAAMGAVRTGRLDAVFQKANDILVRAQQVGYEPFECWARLLLAAVAERRGDLAAATGELVAAREVAERLGLPHYVAFVLTELGRLTMLDGDLPGAHALQSEALAAAETGDSPWHAALARCGLAETLRHGGDDAAAEAVLRAVRAWAESPEARRTRATFFTVLGGSPYARCLIGLGLLAAADGRERESALLLPKALEWAQRAQDHPAAAAALEALAGNASAAGESERAAILLGVADAHRTASAQRPGVDRVAAQIGSELGAEAAEAARARGRRLALPDAIALVHS